MMNKKDVGIIIKDLSEKPFVCSEHYIETESGYVITTKEKRKYARRKPQTNADRIRNMTDEELAIIIMCPYDGTKDGDCFMKGRNCIQCCKEWLQAEVKEGAE